MIDIKLGKLKRWKHLSECVQGSVCLLPLTKKKILEVSCACQMSEYLMFSALNEILKFQNDPNRPGSITQINASKVKHVFLHEFKMKSTV